jgi:acetyl/propionyl-CoA carboxylase alpha subunit
MKRFVNGDETELDADAAEVVRLSDRLMVRTESGTFSALAIRQGEVTLVSYKGCQYRVEDRPPRVRAGAQAGSGELRAPMPGQIVDVRHALGDLLKIGDTILVLEAMKTQQPFLAPFDGKLTQIAVVKDDQVSADELLAVVERVEMKHA